MFRMIVATIVAVFMLSGCQKRADEINLGFINKWLTPSSDLAPLPAHLPMARLEPVWQTEVKTGFTENLFNDKTRIIDHQFVGNDLYVTKNNAQIIKIDKTTGHIRDQFVLLPNMTTGPAFSDVYVYALNDNGELIAFDANKQTVWRQAILGEALVSPIIHNDNVIVQTTNGKVIAFNQKTGEQLWQYEEEMPSLTLRGTSRPVPYQDIIVTGFANGKVIALDSETGIPVWERRIAFPKGQSDLAKLVDINIEPVIYDGVIYVGAYQGNLVALQVRTGELIWNKPFSTTQPISISDKLVVAVDEDDLVWAIDRANGTVKWQHKYLKGRKLTAAYVWDEVVAVSDSGGYVHMLSRLTGLNISQSQITSDEIKNTPFLHDNQVYLFNDEDLTVSAYGKVDERVERFKQRQAAQS